MKREKNRKLHGSVLLTVVFVMAVLIVFLFGTLTLALAANNRAHVNYSSAQTGITARAVAESAIKAIDNSTTSGKAYAKAIGQLSEGQEKRVKVDINGDGAGSLGHADEVVISYAGKKKFYDVDKEDWFERDLLKFTSNVTLAGVEQSSSVYVLKHYQEDNDGGGSGGAGFVTTADAHFNTQTSIFGGAYISLPCLDDIKNFSYDYKDKSTFKVQEDDGSVRQLIGTPSETQFTLTNSSAFAEADLYVCNNMYVENWSGFIFPRQGTGVTVWGDFGFHGNAGDHLKYAYHGTTTDLTFNKIPYFYINGKVYTSGGDAGSRSIRFGNTTTPFPMNVFCGQLEANNSKLHIASSIYCMDSDKENILVGSDPDSSTMLYAWTGNVINKAKGDIAETKVVGDVCSNGTKLTVDCVEIKGDVRSAGDLVIGKHAIIRGNVVCSGTLQIEEGAKIDGKIYNNSFTGNVQYENVIGYYYRHEVTLDSNGNYTRPDGNPITLDGYYNNGKLVEGANYDDAKVLYYICRWDYNPDTDRKYGVDYNIKPLVEGVDDIYFADPDLAVLSFYAESKIDGTENVFVDGAWVQRPKVVATSQKYTPVPDQFFEVPMFADDPDDPKYKSMDDYPEGTAYPNYAKREVLLGLEAPTGTASDTKVVKTMEEVLKNVADPYKAADLPAEMLTKYNKFFAQNGDGTSDYSTYSEDGNKAYCDSVDDVKNYTGYYLTSIDANGNYTYAAKDVTATKAGLYVDKDIILDMNGWGTDQGKDLVINPDGNNLLVVVKNFSVPSGYNITVDDSKGGSVYFYVDRNSTWSCNGNEILTKSYKDVLQNNNALKYHSNASDPGFDIGTMTNVKPNIYVYGAPGSKLAFSNMSIVTANIISPYLGGSIAGGTGSGIDSFYYDGFNIRKPDGVTDVASQFIIGCLNAQNVSSSNQVNVVYVTDDGEKHGGGQGEDDEFWYKVLYYSEF
ncbi:MAG: polymer-forming cytoskeletal protein [Ruminococcus sp.]|nr:polymer-forming cytoskeletal protein [Ruminococcus sp.]